MRLSSALLFSVALLAATAALVITSEPPQGPRYVAIPSPYPTIEWGQIWAPEPITAVGFPVQILTASDTHYLVADAACTVTTIATDGDCWSHTSGGAGGAGVPGQNNAVIMDANSGGGTFTVDAAMSIASLDMTGSTGTLNLGSATVTVYGNWTGTATRGTSTVVFAASGNLNTPTGTSFKFYNLTINAGVTVTNTTAASGNFFVWVQNTLTVNGTLLGGSPNDPQLIFMVGGEFSSTALVLGAGGDVDTSGYFIYRYRGACGGTMDITAATYQHLGVQGGNSTCAVTFNLLGNVSTPSCGVYRDCAIIFHSEATGTPAANAVLNTNGYSITAGGTLWLGDGGTTGLTGNMGASSVTAYGISPTGSNVIVNWNTATVTARPSSIETNLCHYRGTTGYTENLNSSTWNCYGQFRTGSTLNAGSATVNVLRDNCGVAAECGFDQAGARSPGEVVILDGGVINMGSSTWVADSIWQNNNVGAQSGWDAGTSTVTFRQTGVNFDYNFGDTTLGEAEFYDVVFDFSGTGNTTAGFGEFNPGDSLWAANSVTVRDTSGGTTTLNSFNGNITSPTVTVGSGGTLTMGTGNLLGVNHLDVDGTLSMDSITVANIDIDSDQSYTFEITAWTAYSLAAASFDVRWTFGSISSATAELTVTLAELTHTVATDYTLARGGANLRAATVPVDETSLTIRWTGGWGSADTMALSSAAATIQVGGGPEEPPFLPPWTVVMLLGAAFVIYVAFRGRKRRKRK